MNLAASALAGLIPAPGGAFAVAITHRLCTNYLPPIWGYASLKSLERKGYV